MEVSVIIVTYNTCQLTKQCVDSIFEHTKDVTFEVIVFDNASSDDTQKVFFEDKRITYIYNDTNLGFGRANNAAFSVAKGKYIFLLNSDTYFGNNAIKIFKDEMDIADNHIACLGTLLENSIGKRVLSFGSFLSFKFFFFESIVSKMFNRPLPLPANGIVPVVIGADLFIRRSVIDECGFFDPRFFMYQEENDLQRRYREAGYYSKIITEPEIIHLEGKSRVNNFMPIIGSFTYMKKWYPKCYILFRILFAITRSYKLFSRSLDMTERWELLKILLT